MDCFQYRNGVLHAEDISLVSIAEQYGTPCYVYSRTAIEQQWRTFDRALTAYPHLICYAVKANSNLAVLNTLAQLGAGFDIVSGGELERVLHAGGQANKIVFSGVGKTIAEMQRALELGIFCFNVESEAELFRLNDVAGKMGKRAPVSLRVNPDVDAKTHPYISTGMKKNKFGIDIALAPLVYATAAQLPHIEVTGVDCHIGSQLTEITPFIDAAQRVMQLVATLKQQGIELKHVDFGGGLGVQYDAETPPSVVEYAQALQAILGNAPYQIVFEPGRVIVANAGILLTKVEYLKQTPEKHFAIVDAAMNDLIRPALYSAWQAVSPVIPREDISSQEYDIVGPICETGDFLAKDRNLSLQPDDLLAIRSAGAYGFAMSSNYNSRPRVAEIMVQGAECRVIRQRENVADLWALERIW
ncbi:diaminopimelate decarboxylase [Beggiatoa leptomitoformis]|uniref:Diaminopimelate decarboxylase n=1 Tax=Beggiatoa leptomitoformis TaxID=288004 RepID=A0A2N9YH01_9GAMM|nr:diaminopimelate decarboxylase [Beggiatoa leptomitoformis]ALG67949.1 diaminopimelate decarboxylase [Beggiatoa leptomitoformis]AUI69777.1 diaminopimelate decarboxylase [Beggiatoa leptomitoformis]